MTIRDSINQIRNEIGETPPADTNSCSEYIVKLVALQGNINDEIGRWEAEYHTQLAAMIDADPKMGVEKLKIKAQASDSFRNLQVAKRVSELVTEMINGLKYRFRALQGEWNNAHIT